MREGSFPSKSVVMQTAQSLEYPLTHSPLSMPDGGPRGQRAGGPPIPLPRPPGASVCSQCCYCWCLCFDGLRARPTASRLKKGSWGSRQHSLKISQKRNHLMPSLLTFAVLLAGPFLPCRNAFETFVTCVEGFTSTANSNQNLRFGRTTVAPILMTIAQTIGVRSSLIRLLPSISTQNPTHSQ